MPGSSRTRSVAALLTALLACASACGLMPEQRAPDPARPWTRWWWLGSAVDEANLTRQLEALAAAGIGGVEICPIYGVQGAGERNLPFLSPRWTAMLAHTSRECARLGLGMDLTTGTGWPFGGPWVTKEAASRRVEPVAADVDAGPVTLALPRGELVCLRAFGGDGAPIPLEAFVADGALRWTADAPCRVRGLVSIAPIQQVKRAAPGGAGNVLDPYSTAALDRYLTRFDAALDGLAAPPPRAHFHDSFEYYRADWTTDLLAAFERVAGYDLRDHLPAFLGEGDDDEVRRVAHDYRATLDDLHRGYLAAWNAWARARGSSTRNQAHGSPGNLLDHYAVADIPETEIFGEVDVEQLTMLRFAASAAHLTGKPLVSAEAFTWLDEHFRVRPAALARAAQLLWLGGVNHVFYHGVPYSPDDAAWPGWLFYAATHVGENGGLWRDLPDFNQYVTTVQRALQRGRPDTQVLLYFPVHDLWSRRTDALPLFTVHAQDEWLRPTGFDAVAARLSDAGIACDFASDRLLRGAEVVAGRVVVGGCTFDTLAVPPLEFLPDETARLLVALRERGADVVFVGSLPTSAPGLLGGALDLPADLPHGVDLLAHLADRGVHREPMLAHGVRFVRRVVDDGHVWLLVNRGDAPVDARVDLTTPCAAAEFVDPRRPSRRGAADLDGGGVRIVLDPGESRLMYTFPDERPPAPRFPEWTATAAAVPIPGPFRLTFVDGGPALPPPVDAASPGTWTEASAAARSFSGTARYEATFRATAGAFVLDLGDVRETCRVLLNGRDLGRSFFPPHRFDVSGALVDGDNTLVVEVTNLAANRVADLDRRGVAWKVFEDVNFVGKDYRPFDASRWAPVPSGLLGPVHLVPVSAPR